MQRIHARPPLVSFGIWMLGPALLKFGSPEQKATHLPRIARGEIRWCQGYSEPGAGSDLASLRTKAEDQGDHFLVNGQKIWTSYADKADWIFCLVRTDPQAVKQKGISFLLIDMATPGVSTKPIVLISGKSPFCETFFDNVAVPKENLVGTLNRGWDVAKYLLTHEREMIAGGGQPLRHPCARPGGRARRRKGGKLADPILRAEIARTAVDTYASEATRQRYLAEAAGGGEIGARSALLKYDGTELNKRRHELMMSLAGRGGSLFRRQSRAGAGRRRAAGCAPRAIRSRAARRRSCSTSSPSGCSNCPRIENAMLILSEDQKMLMESARGAVAAKAPIAEFRKLRADPTGLGFSPRVLARVAPNSAGRASSCRKRSAASISASSAPD